MVSVGVKVKDRVSVPTGSIEPAGGVCSPLLRSRDPAGVDPSEFGVGYASGKDPTGLGRASTAPRKKDDAEEQAPNKLTRDSRSGFEPPMYRRAVATMRDAPSCSQQTALASIPAFRSGAPVYRRSK